MTWQYVNKTYSKSIHRYASWLWLCAACMVWRVVATMGGVWCEWLRGERAVDGELRRALRCDPEDVGESLRAARLAWRSGTLHDLNPVILFDIKHLTAADFCAGFGNARKLRTVKLMRCPAVVAPGFFGGLFNPPSVFKVFKTAEQLEDLTLCLLGLSAQDWELLPELKSLKSLRLWQHYVSDKVFESISQLSELMELEICSCKGFSGPAFGTLGQLPKLTDLTCNSSQSVDKQGLKQLSRSRSLKNLTLQHHPTFDDEALFPLANIATLEQLKVSGCSGLTREGLKDLWEATEQRLNIVSGPFQSMAERPQERDPFRVVIDVDW